MRQEHFPKASSITQCLGGSEGGETDQKEEERGETLEMTDQLSQTS